MQAVIVDVLCQPGDQVNAGSRLIVLEAMKMQHVIKAESAGQVTDVAVNKGDVVDDGTRLCTLHVLDAAPATRHEATPSTPQHDAALADLQRARALTLDDARPDVVSARHAKGKRMARENIAALVDPGSFREYGALVFAAQRTRRSEDDLRRNTPADGMVAGLATINAQRYGEQRSHCIVLHYDYTVLAGTQGALNHAKTDRLLEIAAKSNRSVVFFTEGGGGRPGDVDVQTLAGLHIGSFAAMARLSGQVPLIGIASGYCFAGNAAFLGCCDVIIATEDASIGMGGPAMIEGGGLGRHRPADVGPTDVQSTNGVIDILVADEQQAVNAAQHYLGFFQGNSSEWEGGDTSILSSLIPANRREVYDMRAVIEALADMGSMLELRAGFGKGMITALARIEGRPVGVIANNPAHLAGAIDHEGADKAARFMQLCDAHALPIVSLCDTPGIMVGPESESHANVRHCSRLFVTGANLSVPIVTLIIRKAYGLGAMAMAGGGFHEPLATLAWPSGEFGAMGLEGAVSLGYRKELEAITDDALREQRFAEMVKQAYERGKALSAATHFEFDDVIDPAESRRWIVDTLSTHNDQSPTTGKRRPNIDTW